MSCTWRLWQIQLMLRDCPSARCDILLLLVILGDDCRAALAFE